MLFGTLFSAWIVSTNPTAISLNFWTVHTKLYAQKLNLKIIAQNSVHCLSRHGHMESENHQTAFRHLGSACPHITCCSGSITHPCVMEIDRMFVYTLCILLKSKHFVPDECVCLCVCVCVCVYICWASSGPSGFERKGNYSWQNGFLICRKEFGANTVLCN